VAVVIKTIQSSRKRLGKGYTALREDDAKNRFNILLRCATHLHHHIGKWFIVLAQKASSS